MADQLSNGFHSMMYCVSEILDKLDFDQEKFTLNAYKLGKLIKRQKVKSKHTLDDVEISYYSRMLYEILKHWGRYGHKDWKIMEKVPSSSLTVQFIRKKDKDYQPQGKRGGF